MKVQHLNCGTLCPLGGRLVSGRGSLFGPARLTCHCLLVETSEGLCLVDTGIGLLDVAAPWKRLSARFMVSTRPRCEREETAARQIAHLGYSTDDVRHIVVTHLDPDHAGGLADFPRAAVHVWGSELDSAVARSSRNERDRYRTPQLAHGPNFVRYDRAGERWFGFDAVRALEGLPPEILLVPLPGHTRGHAGVAVATSKGFLLHAGDAFFTASELDPVRPYAPLLLRWFQRTGVVDASLWETNLARLRELAQNHGDEVRLLCSHDAETFDALASRSSRFAPLLESSEEG